MKNWNPAKLIVCSQDPHPFKVSRHLRLEQATLVAAGPVASFNPQTPDAEPSLFAQISIFRKPEESTEWLLRDDDTPTVNNFDWEQVPAAYMKVALCYRESGNKYKWTRGHSGPIELQEGDVLRFAREPYNTQHPVRLVLAFQTPSQLSKDLERTMGDNARPQDFTDSDMPDTRLQSIMFNTSRQASEAELLSRKSQK